MAKYGGRFAQKVPIIKNSCLGCGELFGEEEMKIHITANKNPNLINCNLWCRGDFKSQRGLGVHLLIHNTWPEARGLGALVRKTLEEAQRVRSVLSTPSLTGSEYGEMTQYVISPPKTETHLKDLEQALRAAIHEKGIQLTVREHERKFKFNVGLEASLGRVPESWAWSSIFACRKEIMFHGGDQVFKFLGKTKVDGTRDWLPTCQKLQCTAMRHTNSAEFCAAHHPNSSQLTTRHGTYRQRKQRRMARFCNKTYNVHQETKRGLQGNIQPTSDFSPTCSKIRQRIRSPTARMVSCPRRTFQRGRQAEVSPGTFQRVYLEGMLQLYSLVVAMEVRYSNMEWHRGPFEDLIFVVYAYWPILLSLASHSNISRN
jgi:hypothetical protein